MAEGGARAQASSTTAAVPRGKNSAPLKKNFHFSFLVFFLGVTRGDSFFIDVGSVS